METFLNSIAILIFFEVKIFVDVVVVAFKVTLIARHFLFLESFTCAVIKIRLHPFAIATEQKCSTNVALRVDFQVT